MKFSEAGDLAGYRDHVHHVSCRCESMTRFSHSEILIDGSQSTENWGANMEVWYFLAVEIRFPSAIS